MMNKSWIFVVLTSICELLWIYGFNVASTGWHWVLIISLIILDFWFLAKACEGLPTGTVYAIFAAAGTVGTALMDVYIFNQTFTLPKVVFICVIVMGVMMLNVADIISERKQQQKEVTNCYENPHYK